MRTARSEEWYVLFLPNRRSSRVRFRRCRRRRTFFVAPPFFANTATRVLKSPFLNTRRSPSPDDLLELSNRHPHQQLLVVVASRVCAPFRLLFDTYAHLVWFG
jgi:hypothetical protein